MKPAKYEEGRKALNGLWVVLVMTALAGKETISTSAQTTLNPTAFKATNSAITTPKPTETVEQRLAKVRSELAALGALGDTNAVSRAAVPSLENSLRRNWLQRLSELYEQQISYASDLQTAKNRRAELALEVKAWTGFGPRPYSILLWDQLRESIQVERAEISNSESAVSMLLRLADEHRTALNRAEENIRQLNEQLEKSGGNLADGGERAWRRELERLRSQTSAASVAALDLEREVREERLAASRIRLGLLERQLVQAKEGVAFTDSDMRTVIGRLDAEQRELERELADTEKVRAAASEALERANADLRGAKTNPDGNSSTGVNEERIDVRRTQVEIADTVRGVLHFLLQSVTAERIIWEVRFAAYRNRDAQVIRETERRSNEFRRRIEIWSGFYRSQLEAASSQLAFQETRLAGMDPASMMASLTTERLAALRERDKYFLRAVRNIERTGRLLERVGEDLREATEGLPLAGRVRNVVSSSESLLSRIWSLELFVAQDTITIEGQQITGKRSVTLGKVISAILIVVVGYWLTGLVSRLADPVIIKRFKIEPNQAGLLRRWFRVVLVSVLVIFSLFWVKIPLTAFAFAGGALMIAVGFGMQTLLKNFVSGIIILFERPFRLGDVLEVGGQRGTVSSIGIRSSVLQLWDSTEMLIPNSTLLESSVINWTYSNRKVRFTVRLGVAYGSDTRRVVQLLTEIVERHGLIEKEPQPQILFVDFAESSLNFEIRFWVDILKANAAQVASDLRQMIAVAFAEQGINIAFPQRDIHLDSARPLQVQVVPGQDTHGEAPAIDAPLGRPLETSLP